MNRRIIFHIIFFLCCHYIYANGHKYYFQSLDIAKGLTQNSVLATLQDSQGFMWFGTQDGLNRYDGLSIQTFMKDNFLESNSITALHEDRQGIIWIGTNAGAYTYSPLTEKIDRFTIKDKKGRMINHQVTMISTDSDYVWISVIEDGLFRYNCKENKLDIVLSKQDKTIQSDITQFSLNQNNTHWLALYADNLYYTDDMKHLKPFATIDGQEPFNGDIINKIIAGNHNRLYIGSAKGGVKEVNLTTKEVVDILVTDKDGKEIYARDLLFFSDYELWIGSESGIYIYNLKTKAIIHLQNSFGDVYTINDNAIYSLYKDKEGGVWVGSYFGGVNYYPKQNTYFEKVYRTQEKKYIGRRIRELCADDNENLWIGTEDNGLIQYNINTKKTQPFIHPSIHKNIHGLCYDGKYLWVGTFSGGLNRVDLKTKEIKTYLSTKTKGALPSDYIFSICYTSSKTLWVGTTSGVVYYNYEKDTFIPVNSMKGMFIYDIKEDSQGDVWFANYTNGLYKLNIKNNEIVHFTHDPMNSGSIPSNRILSIFEDSKKQIWITTNNSGFSRYYHSTGKFVSYNHTNGLPSNVVHQIIEDNNNKLWITTNDGLVFFDPVTEKMKIFTTGSGLLSNQFNYKSSYKDQYGRIYLGSIEGLIIFDPTSFLSNTFIPPIVITDFSIFNKKVIVGAKNSPLSQSISFSSEIELRSDENTFSFSVSALSYNTPKKTRLIYKLDGFDKEWNSVEDGKIFYSNLSPGDYLLEIKRANSDGLWNDSVRRLKIRINPPYYLSIGALILYALLTITVIVRIYFYLKRRTLEKQRREMEQFEYEKDMELYQSKIDFFTNVTHEIRTPLTLIKSPLENILKMDKIDNSISEDLLIMDRNANRLLNLTNQLLDFRKTEENLYKLNFNKVNINELLRDIFIRFTSLAKQKELKFTLALECTDQEAIVDKEALNKILSNLLSNAFKFAETYIHVSLNRDHEQFEIEVSNDGYIIPLESRKEIFLPFIQMQNESSIKSGTGIGLSLARSLAELHQGSLAMDNDLSCDRFVLSIPHSLMAYQPKKNENNAEYQPANKETSDFHKNNATILLVDDDADIITFLNKHLSTSYNTYTANNGMEALEILKKQSINIIVSDITMPSMNGLELCNKVKSDVNYSHIPIVLLTSKTAIQSEIEGLQFGADAYIKKPFSLELLKANISNLIENRIKMLQAFAYSPLVSLNAVSSTKADEEFIKQLSEVVNKNIQDPNFGLDQMAGELNMSRSSLNRKMRGLLDLTPNDYIRIERLKRAAYLLKEQECRVAEVCYMVGFSSPSYFTKCFREQFGVLPKEFASSSK